MPARLFPVGDVYATPGAHELIEAGHFNPLVALTLHSVGEWGDLDDEDKAANHQAIENGSRILSKYHANTGAAVYIITNADRKTTTILLPSEY